MNSFRAECRNAVRTWTLLNCSHSSSAVHSRRSAASIVRHGLLRVDHRARRTRARPTHPRFGYPKQQHARADKGEHRVGRSRAHTLVGCAGRRPSKQRPGRGGQIKGPKLVRKIHGCLFAKEHQAGALDSNHRVATSRARARTRLVHSMPLRSSVHTCCGLPSGQSRQNNEGEAGQSHHLSRPRVTCIPFVVRAQK